MRFDRPFVAGVCACVVALGMPARAAAAAAQEPPPVEKPAPAPAPSADPLGRSTPRGTVLRFLSAGRAGEDELARQYLDTQASGRAAHVLAHQLYVVLDARLPARLTQISESPEGSRANPLQPERELVGTIESRAGSVDVHVVRVDRGEAGRIWLFESATLDRVPALFAEVTASEGDSVVPRFLIDRKVGSVRIIDLLVLLFGIPAFLFGTAVLNRLLVPMTRPLVQRLFRESEPSRRNALPVPARLLLLAIATRWLVSGLPLSLMVRQFCANAANVIMIVALAWLLMLATGEAERYIHRHAPRSNVAAAASLLRVLRRAVDLLILFAALMVMLRYFGVDPTPALAGLGVGGIAVALAAQKTLENVIAGASLIFDQAVQVGDFLKMGDVVGTVDHIGLRSTRIRTLDRTVVSVPNSQIANASLETISARDKYWFHPVISLRYETTPSQLHAVVDGIHRMLTEDPSIEIESVRVRFVRIATFSLDVEVFAYFFARDWNHFLEIQERLLFRAAEIVERAGTGIALPSQTTYVARTPEAMSSPDPAGPMTGRWMSTTDGTALR